MKIYLVSALQAFTAFLDILFRGTLIASMYLTIWGMLNLGQYGVDIYILSVGMGMGLALALIVIAAINMESAAFGFSWIIIALAATELYPNITHFNLAVAIFGLSIALVIYCVIKFQRTFKALEAKYKTNE